MDLEKGVRARGKWAGGHGGLCLTAASYLMECSVVFDSLRPYGLLPARLFCPWIFPARILEWIVMPSSRGSSSLGLNPRLLYYRWTFYHWAIGEVLWRTEVKGLAGSIMKDQDSFECWPDRGGHICFALENPRLIKFYEQGKANERHLRRAEDSRWVTPAARRPAPMVGAVNLVTFHRPDMAAWLGDRAYATWHVESRARSHPPPSTFSSCCPTLTPSASTASSDMTRQIFWAVAIASWALGVSFLAALVLGCINLVF